MVDRWDRAARIGAALGLAAVLAGCAGGGSASMSSASTPPATASALATVSAPASTATIAPSGASGGSVAPSASMAPVPAAPPTALLGGLSGDTAADGALGTYFWADVGTDAPWIVGKRAGAAGAGARLHVTFGGALAATWTSAWAKVVQGSAGSPVGSASGEGDISLSTPASGGDWTLRVSAVFGPAANATYYWRVTVTP